ncbi:alpha/beta hydrolase [Halorientalis sp. IM1011]|uniref:alpha/beta hydrolase n=1 Tax=Halorientalis sp. IM1011 TaxID=1932360 RepID=UPI00097CC6F9|nr:alpha/beta hydrolase [Halorientalis sp. IM1011]AQL41376.1 alpha/beta hydrolase [Halorientalis sp. IM1011]
MADQPHPQVQAVLQMIDDQPVPPIHAVSVAEARGQMEAMASMRGDGEDVGNVETFEIQGPEEPLPVRLYHPDGDGPHPVLVYFHGGGFVIGSLETHDALCRSLTNAADCAVLSVDYRLAPENPFPAAVEDAYAAVEWVADHGEPVDLDPGRIAVGGDSAGANLAAATTLAVQDRGGPELAHQALIYPVVSSPVVGEEFDSYEENAEGYFLERDTMEWFHEKYVRDEIHLRNEYFAPLLAADLSGVPSATIVTAGFDPLRDEGIAYADRLESEGVDVTRDHYEDMIHGFASMVGVVDAAEESIDSIAADLDDAF